MPVIHKRKDSNDFYIKSFLPERLQDGCIVTFQISKNGQNLLNEYGLLKDEQELSLATIVIMRKIGFLFLKNDKDSPQNIEGEWKSDYQMGIEERNLLQELRKFLQKDKEGYELPALFSTVSKHVIHILTANMLDSEKIIALKDRRKLLNRVITRKAQSRATGYQQKLQRVGIVPLKGLKPFIELERANNPAITAELSVINRILSKYTRSKTLPLIQSKNVDTTASRLDYCFARKGRKRSGIFDFTGEG